MIGVTGLNYYSSQQGLVSGLCEHSDESLNTANCGEFLDYPSSYYPLGTVRPLYRTGVSLLYRERFLYIYSTNTFHYLIFA